MTPSTPEPTPGRGTTHLELIVPGGFERCLAELYRPGKRPATELEQLWAQYDIQMDPDSASAIMKRHQLRRLATT